METTKIKTILSGKYFTVGLLLICLLGRVIQLLFFYNIRVDGSYQVMAMQHLVHGHGISLGQVFPSDLSQTVYQPLINWPPGYSLLLAPLYLLFGHNYIAAGITLDIICASFLIFISRSLLRLLGVPLYLRNLFTFLTSFFIYSFYFIASSDAVAIPFFIAAVYFTIRLSQPDNRWKQHTLGMSLCLLVCASLKYLFIPIVLIPPLFLLVKGLAGKKRAGFRAGLFTLFILLVTTGGFLLYQQAISGRAGYISEPDRGFFPGHLLDSYPFIPAAFLKPDTVEKTGLAPGLIRTAYLVIHGIAFLYLFFVFVRHLFLDRLRKSDPITCFFYLIALLALGIVSLLSFLSLRVAKEENVPGNFWTYVEEARYYGLITVLLQAAIFVYYLAHRPFRPVFYLCLLLLSVEAARGVFFDMRRIALLNKEEYSWQYENRFQQFAHRIIEKEKQKTGIRNAVVTGSVYFMNHRVSLYSHVPLLYQTGQLNQPGKLRSKKECLLLVILRQPHLAQFSGFLSYPDKEFAGQFDDFYFYVLYVKPD